MFPNLVNRSKGSAVALETTLLLHGVPRESAVDLARALQDDVRAQGAEPALVGVVAGVPTVGIDDQELQLLLAAPEVAKANTANLGALMHRRAHAATTVSTTMELAAAAGVRLFATGGLGGVHRGYDSRLDISSDLAALSRFPVAVVTSGVKSILDVASTREVLETLGVPVVGFGCDEFPAFYSRAGGVGVDVRFDDPMDLAEFLNAELSRTRRGVVVANPVPAEHEIAPSTFERWLAEARAGLTSSATGRDVTPGLLAALHRISGGATLRSNIELVRSNARLAAALAVALVNRPHPM